MARYVTVSLPETRCFAAAAPEELPLHVGAACVIDRDGALELCRIRLLLDAAPPCMARKPIPARVVRLATLEDRERARVGRGLEAEVMRQFDAEAARDPRNVHAVAARFSLDRSRLLVIYHADQRFDARAASASLNRRFRAAVETRQVGIRDETAVLGGIGSCGRPVCCATWLQAFQPVNVRMAKDQDVSLNPNTINGTCGRLKCCLRYEWAPAQTAAPEELEEEP